MENNLDFWHYYTKYLYSKLGSLFTIVAKFARLYQILFSDCTVPFPHLRFLKKFLDYFPGRSSNAYEQQMRREDTMELVKQWIPFVIGGIVCLLCSVSVYSYWTYRQDKNLFQEEILYDQYIKDVENGRISEAKEEQSALKVSHHMGALMDIEATSLAVSTQVKALVESQHQKTDWKKICAAYRDLDGRLFPKNREQTSLYHVTQFLLAVLAVDHAVNDAKMTKAMQNYLQGKSSFSSLVYGIQALQQLASGSAEIKALEQWETASGSWIASACIMGAEISRFEPSSKK